MNCDLCNKQIFANQIICQYCTNHYCSQECMSGHSFGATQAIPQAATSAPYGIQADKLIRQIESKLYQGGNESAARHLSQQLKSAKHRAEILNIITKARSNSVNTIVLNQLIKKCDFNIAHRLYSLAIQYNVGSVVTYNSFITAAGNCGQFQAAKTAYDACHNKDVVTYSSFITAAGNCGQFQAAKTAYDACPQKNVVTYNSFINVLYLAGAYTDAIELMTSVIVIHPFKSQYDMHGHGFCLVMLLINRLLAEPYSVARSINIVVGKNNGHAILYQAVLISCFYFNLEYATSFDKGRVTIKIPRDIAYPEIFCPVAKIPHYFSNDYSKSDSDIIYHYLENLLYSGNNDFEQRCITLINNLLNPQFNHYYSIKYPPFIMLQNKLNYMYAQWRNYKRMWVVNLQQNRTMPYALPLGPPMQ